MPPRQRNAIKESKTSSSRVQKQTACNASVCIHGGEEAKNHFAENNAP